MPSFNENEVSGLQLTKDIMKEASLGTTLSDKDLKELIDRAITRAFWERMVMGDPDKQYESITLPKISQYNPYGDIHKKIEGWLK